MSAATESTPMEVPVAQSQPEVTSPPVNEQDTAPLAAEPAVQASQPDAGDEEPSPKKAKVEEATPQPPVKPGRRSRGSGVSIAEQTRKEAEALIKDLKDTPDGGRRTRSQTRGTPAPSPVQKASRAARKPREATPAVKSTTPSSAEKKPSSGGRRGRGRGRGRGRPPSKKAKAGADEEADVPADEEDQGEDTADDVDANNGTETTSSDAPAAPVTENGVGGDGHEEPEPAAEGSKPAAEGSKPAAEESKPAAVEERKGEESPSDPWAVEAAKPTPPSDPLAVESAAASQPSVAESQPAAVAE